MEEREEDLNQGPMGEPGWLPRSGEKDPPGPAALIPTRGSSSSPRLWPQALGRAPPLQRQGGGVQPPRTRGRKSAQRISSSTRTTAWRRITLSRKNHLLLPTQAVGPREEMETSGEALSGAVWDGWWMEL